MVTSAEFDEVLVPVDYQKDVLMRTFDSLIGFNKKNKKGKFMKAIKEEWVYDPVLKKSVFKDRDAERRETQAKKDNGTYKVVDLDAKKSKPKAEKTSAEEKADKIKKAEGKELYSGNLVNKKGKTIAQVEKEARERARVPRAIRKEIPEPGDTHYTCEEMGKLIWKHSAAARQKYVSNLAIQEKLAENEALRKKWDEKLISKFGHKPEDQVKKTRSTTPKTAISKVELEDDPYKIADWFWDKKDTNDFKIMFPDVGSYSTLFRTIKNDARGIKFFAKLMRDRGYRKTPDKPFVAKATLIKKKPEAAKDFEELGEAAVGFDDALEVLRGPIKKVQKAYKEADQRIGIGINWAMEELFGSGWERI